MKGFRSVAFVCLLSPLAALAQAPIIDGSSGGARPSQPATPAPATSGGRLSIEGQLMQQVDQLQQEVSMLRGLLEEQEHRLKQLEQNQLDQYEDLDRRLTSMTGGTTALPRNGRANGSPDDPLATVQPPSNQAPAANAPTAQQQSGANRPDAPSQQAPADPEREKLLYEAAFDLVKTRDFEKAAMAFNAFLRRYPDSTYAGNAQYWLGEVHLAQSDLESAGRAFAQVISNFQGHRKEADALYKLADVERRLGNADKARQLYQEVLSKHPGSSAAQLARRDLDNLG
ncbi:MULTISPECIES: tol-pal system protein YbgF [Pseudomonas]|uniref:tol-pal system protein YbgF n=1 Tax=Pseudomonas TaxID=286 RepID=UPI001238A7AD|nr:MULTISPECIES: tol-pal system protein YbgF [Pseudomonas]QIB51402.1 tol-pal system protein YbgF [Pseudomonas sp. OIL-1]